MSGYLRDYQEACRDETLRELANGSDKTLFVMPTGCVSGDAVLGFNRAGKGYRRTIQKQVRAASHHCYRADIPTFVRSWKDDRVGINRVLAFQSSGKRSTCELALVGGNRLRLTADHQVLTSHGFVAAGDLTGTDRVICEGTVQRSRAAKKNYLMIQGLKWHPYASRFKSRSTRRGTRRPEGTLYRVPVHRLVAEARLNELSLPQLVYLCRHDAERSADLQFLDPARFAVHHLDGEPLNNTTDNLLVCTHADHHRLHGRDSQFRNLPGFDVVEKPVACVRPCGIEDTWDVACEAPHHNFIANGIVVHNCGKTEVALDVLDQWPDKDCDILCIAHREELIYQPWERWHKKTGWWANIEMADSRRAQHIGGRVTFASKDSLYPSRLRQAFPDPKSVGLIWVDEAHHLAKGNQSYTHIVDYFLEANPDCRLFGCTATPDRTDEKALGEVFDSVAYEYPLVDPNGGPSAIRDGWLVNIEQEIVTVEDLEFDRVGKRGGDFIESQLAAEIMRNEAVEKMVAATRGIAGDKTCLIFTAGIDQAVASTVALNAERPGCAYAIASRVPDSAREYKYVLNSADKELRKSALKRWAAGAFQYFCNVGVFTEGTDEPRIAVLSMGRPTKSRSLYSQMAGRGMRVLPGLIEGVGDDGNYWRIDDREERLATIRESAKPSVLILDFVGNSRHSLISSADILGGQYDDEVVELAKDKLGQGDRDVLGAIEEAAEEIERSAMERQRASVQARGRVTRRKLDPFTVLGVRSKREPGWHCGRQPTQKQLAALRKFKIPDYELGKLSFTQASQLMDKLVGRIKKQQCTYRMAQILMKHGFHGDRGFAEASAIIDRIAKSGWQLQGEELDD